LTNLRSRRSQHPYRWAVFRTHDDGREKATAAMKNVQKTETFRATSRGTLCPRRTPVRLGFTNCAGTL